MGDEVMWYMGLARKCMEEERDEKGLNSRELSVTLTQLETAMLWRQKALEKTKELSNKEGVVKCSNS
jgi:hypothetical protein